MDEVPRLERPLLALDQQQALALEDEEVLLLVLAVVHARRLAGLKDADVDPELRELRLRALEARERAEVAVEPARLLRVQHEPAFASRDEAAVTALEGSLGNHSRSLACGASLPAWMPTRSRFASSAA